MRLRQGRCSYLAGPGAGELLVGLAVGCGHGQEFWVPFQRALHAVDPGTAVNIEHEDAELDQLGASGWPRRTWRRRRRRRDSE